MTDHHFCKPSIRACHSYLLIVLLAAIAVSSLTWPAKAQTNTLAMEIPQALFVPLDDRPSTHLFPQQIARIGGGQLCLPQRTWLGSAYTPGDTSKIASWLRQQASQHRQAIISADMVIYGGLLASRSAATTTEQAQQRLQVFRQLHQLGVKQEVFVILPRLSLRTSQAQAPYEAALANWARTASANYLAKVNAEYVDEYLGVRRRNIEIISQLVKLTNEGVIEQLIIGQDDSNKTGLHLDEQKSLRDLCANLGVLNQVKIVSGADELGVSLTAGWICKAHNFYPQIEIRYSKPEAASQIPPLESLSLEESVAQHMRLSRAQRTYNQGTVLLINTPGDKPFAAPPTQSTTQAKELASNIVDDLKQLKRAGRKFGFIDIYLINRAEPAVADGLLDSLKLWDLEAYAAWNTCANSIGTGIAQAAVHQLAAAKRNQWPISRSLESEKTQQAFTFARFIDDYAYQALIRPQASAYAKGLPINPEALLNLYGPAGVAARTEAVAWTNKVWNDTLKGQTYRFPGTNYQLTFSDLNVQAVLPWPRVFELEVRLDLRLKVSPLVGTQPTGKLAPPQVKSHKPPAK